MADDAAAPAADVQDGQITVADFEGEQDPKAEPSTVEAKPEVAKDKVEAPAPPDVPTKDEGTQPEAKAEEPDAVETEEKPQGKAEERKTQLNTEIRDLVAQRNALKEEVAKANEVYQPATEQELEADGLSATDAKVEALRQQIALKDYNDKVADAQLTIESESQRVLNDFPIFNPDSSQYNQPLAERTAAMLEKNLIIDQNTSQIIGSNVSPYELYQTIAEASGISVVEGQLKGQQDTETMLANADAGGAAAPQKKAEDPLMKLFLED